jgi:hypothetical protein
MMGFHAAACGQTHWPGHTHTVACAWLFCEAATAAQVASHAFCSLLLPLLLLLLLLLVLVLLLLQTSPCPRMRTWRWVREARWVQQLWLCAGDSFLSRSVTNIIMEGSAVTSPGAMLQSDVADAAQQHPTALML